MILLHNENIISNGRLCVNTILKFHLLTLINKKGGICMAQNNLPEVFETVRGIVGYDNGNVFDRNILFPKRAEKRLDIQKEIMLRMMEVNEETELAKIEAQKEITLAQLQYSYEFQKLKHETFRQVIERFSKSDLGDLDGFCDFASSGISNIGNTISNL